MSSSYKDCTGCKRCETICPENSPIAQIMEMFKEIDEKDNRAEVAERFDRELRKHTGCVNCARCLPYCPEQINIPYYILSAKEDFE